MRNRIWYTLVDTKTNEYYTVYVTKFYQICEWLTNTVLVITTSSSVAAWAIWQRYSLVWVFVIGGSQLLTLIKPFLLFPRYVRSYNEKAVNFQNISCDLESLWYRLERDKITEDEAEREYNDIKKRLVENDKFPDEVIVFMHKSALTKAEERTQTFLNRL